MAVTDN